MILILLESVVMCFILLMICVIGIADGAVGSVYFFEKEVQERVVELGLTTKEIIRKRAVIASIFLYASTLFLVPAMVYFINNAREFWDLFRQMTIIFWIMGLFDRLFIDWYWVGHTKTWMIPGTEDLMPYIPKKTLIKKWVGTIVGYPVVAWILSIVISVF
ncbi:MAG: hypothetical protein K2J71_07590 [Oscillospiraceae bacterium]|nr:hypothetical protein [Oscillospiraceae bacterium]